MDYECQIRELQQNDRDENPRGNNWRKPDVVAFQHIFGI